MAFEKWAYLIMAVLGGICISPQGAINAVLGKKIGPLQAATVSFAVGLVSVVVASLLFAKKYPAHWSRLREAPAYAWGGGFLGAIIVVTTLVVVPKIGATPTLLGILIGQAAVGIFMDHYGWFGVPAVPFDPWRIVGLALLVVALPLVSR